MSITGEPDGAPMKVGVALADVVAGKDACIAILAALVARSRTGRGRHVTVSLAGSASAALVNVAQNALVSGEEPRRWGNGHPNLVPYQLFHAADRPMIIAVGNDSQWKACAAALDLQELVESLLQALDRVEIAPRQMASRMRRVLRRMGLLSQLDRTDGGSLFFPDTDGPGLRHQVWHSRRSREGARFADDSSRTSRSVQRGGTTRVSQQNPRAQS